MGLGNTYRIFHTNTKGHSTQQRKDGSPKQITSWDTNQISNFRKIKKTTLSILSDHNAPQLKTDSRQISSKYPNSWSLNNTLLNDDEWVKGEIKKETEHSPELEENTTRNL